MLAWCPAVWNFKIGISKHCLIQWSKVIFQLRGTNSLSHPASCHTGLLCYKNKNKKMKTKTQIIYLNCHYLLMDHRFQMEKKSLLMRNKVQHGMSSKSQGQVWSSPWAPSELQRTGKTEHFEKMCQISTCVCVREMTFHGSAWLAKALSTYKI